MMIDVTDRLRACVLTGFVLGTAFGSLQPRSVAASSPNECADVAWQSSRPGEISLGGGKYYIRYDESLQSFLVFKEGKGGWVVGYPTLERSKKDVIRRVDEDCELGLITPSDGF